MTASHDDMAYLRGRLDAISDDVARNRSRLESLESIVLTKVSSDSFTPIKMIVYGLVMTVLLGALKAIMSLTYVIK